MAAVNFPASPSPFEVFVAPGTGQKYQFIGGRWVAVERAKRLEAE